MSVCWKNRCPFKKSSKLFEKLSDSKLVKKCIVCRPFKSCLWNATPSHLHQRIMIWKLHREHLILICFYLLRSDHRFIHMVLKICHSFITCKTKGKTPCHLHMTHSVQRKCRVNILHNSSPGGWNSCIRGVTLRITCDLSIAWKSTLCGCLVVLFPEESPCSVIPRVLWFMSVVIHACKQG